jgi:hypothetical protein
MPTGTARGSQASSVKRNERRFMTYAFFLHELSDALSIIYRRFLEGKIQYKISSSSTKLVREPTFLPDSFPVLWRAIRRYIMQVKHENW